MSDYTVQPDGAGGVYIGTDSESAAQVLWSWASGDQYGMPLYGTSHAALDFGGVPMRFTHMWHLPDWETIHWFKKDLKKALDQPLRFDLTTRDVRRYNELIEKMDAGSALNGCGPC